MDILIFFASQLICIGLAVLAYKNEPDSYQKTNVLLMSMIPLIGYLVAFFCALMILNRLIVSSGKCSLGHDYHLINSPSLSFNATLTLIKNHRIGDHICQRCEYVHRDRA